MMDQERLQPRVALLQNRLENVERLGQVASDLLLQASALATELLEMARGIQPELPLEVSASASPSASPAPGRE
jgi:hypothetical protein